MYLSREQEKMLNGEYGWVYARALEVIVKVGESLGAEKLVPIVHAHISGVSYTNIGEPGLGFIKDFYSKGARVRVYSTINPGCIDLAGSSQVISSSFREKQLEINMYLEKMGFEKTFTCIPYLHRKPGINEHLAWGESSAVIFANSIFGARTNREGGPLALAAALTGYTYYWGLHILDNRVVSTKIDVSSIRGEYYGALGLWLGEHIREIPMLTGISGRLDLLKILLAASAASGDHGLIVLENITPEKTYLVNDKIETVFVDENEIEEYIGSMPSRKDKILGYIGCPHLDPYEFEKLVEIISKNDKGVGDNLLLVSIPYIYMEVFKDEIGFLKSRGVDIVVGTCPIVSKLSREFDYLVTNSGKAVFYMSRLHKLNTYITSFERTVDLVYGG
ncbi:MAG: aconitase [Desulfurococcales archaeon ex4484_58]|nr:MAG: aconitase [Desulfurococcales archaeon ex4484_58]